MFEDNYFLIADVPNFNALKGKLIAFFNTIGLSTVWADYIYDQNITYDINGKDFHRGSRNHREVGGTTALFEIDREIMDEIGADLITGCETQSGVWIKTITDTQIHIGDVIL